MGAVAEREVTASQDRGALAKMVMTLLDHWKLSTEDQAALLGIATSNRAALSNYRSGKPIGTSRDQYERVGHLLRTGALILPSTPRGGAFAVTRSMFARRTTWPMPCVIWR